MGASFLKNWMQENYTTTLAKRRKYSNCAPDLVASIVILWDLEKRSGQLFGMSHDIKTMFLKNDQGIVKVDLHLFYGLWQGGEFKGL